MAHKDNRLFVLGRPPGLPANELSSPPTLEALYREHAAFVARLALRLMGREADVDDVVHDVFFDLMRQLHGLDRPDELRGWLATVTVRVARRRLRRAKLRRWIHLGDEPPYEEMAAPDASPEEAAQVAAVYRVLASLPTVERLAWTLRYVEGESLADVAARCEVSLATAKRKIAAAAARLRRELGEWTDT